MSDTEISKFNKGSLNLPSFKFEGNTFTVTANENGGDKREQLDNMAKALGSDEGQEQAMKLFFLSHSTKCFKMDDNKRFTTVLNKMARFEPQDAIEAQLIEEMIETHGMYRQAMYIAMADNDMDLRRQWMDMANKLSRTYIAQLEGLRKYRSGGEQIVKHVHVNEGGQAAFIETYEGGQRGK